MMIQILKNAQACKKLTSNTDYSLYINNTLKLEFDHFREPEDLARLLRDAADAVDLSNNITPPHLVVKIPPKKKLSMMERMNGIAQHLEKQEMDY
jgi:hypothetical protein